ncbi:hypothetical protein GCK72_009444 [Caenorhabditis remanei]|uniref:DBF4-type domain-containing protein n=1 Tax=Caenorhabditis remanei TaxID=31234 RepID=A0A6A5H081_CAERE|nr:hypothetical protein GCK72_009444 [Caenorhabditis remanei]KAF1761190.1 hypothetical protein GCK72_009444 [Caenorhabditis remanei]
MRTSVAEHIENAGGNILVSFEERNPHCLISDHPMAAKLSKAKEGDTIFTSEKMLKLMPSLIRQAVSRKVKVRTPESFLEQMASFFNRKGKTTSATSSHSTIRGRPSINPSARRESSVKPERTDSHVAPRTSRATSEQPNLNDNKERAFLRIDVPSRRPDIRFINKDSFDKVYSGTDGGYSVFKPADDNLKERKRKEYDMFEKGRYEAVKKSFKFDERDLYCQFCQRKIVGERRDHERTDEHRNKAKSQGLTPALERIVMNARISLQSHEKREKYNLKRSRDSMALVEKSKRANVEFEYGENEMKANWQRLKVNSIESVPKKVSGKIVYYVWWRSGCNKYVDMGKFTGGQSEEINQSLSGSMSNDEVLLPLEEVDASNVDSRREEEHRQCRGK